MTAQVAEWLIYNGSKYVLLAEPLEQSHKKPKTGPRSTALIRGYIATFEIRGGELFLKDIQIETQSDPQQLESVMHEFTGGQDELKADWFTGVLNVGDGLITEYIHVGHASIYENHILIEIENGNFIQETKMSGADYKRLREKQVKSEFAQVGKNTVKSIVKKTVVFFLLVFLIPLLFVWLMNLFPALAPYAAYAAKLSALIIILLVAFI